MPCNSGKWIVLLASDPYETQHKVSVRAVLMNVAYAGDALAAPDIADDAGVLSWMRKGDLIGLIMNGNSALTAALLEDLTAPTPLPAGIEPAGLRSAPAIFRINKVVFGFKDSSSGDKVVFGSEGMVGNKVLEALGQMDLHQHMDLYAKIGKELLSEPNNPMGGVATNGDVLENFVASEIF